MGWKTGTVQFFAAAMIVENLACSAQAVGTAVGCQARDTSRLKVERAYVLTGPCKNWLPALEIAKGLSGCGSWGNRLSCPRCNLPCNVCQFLEDGHLPVAHIVPHINFSLRPISAVGVPAGSGDDVKEAAFRDWLCVSPKHKDTLAKAMLHEAIHLCKEIAPPTSTMSDGPLRDLLEINPWPFPPDTGDLVDECWKSR